MAPNRYPLLLRAPLCDHLCQCRGGIGNRHARLGAGVQCPTAGAQATMGPVLSPGLGFQGPIGWTAREGPAHWRLSQLSTPTRPGGHFIIACAARWEDPTLAPRNFSTFER